jgi:hypothetical protein
VFYGLVFLDVVFEAFLFSSDGEADVFLEVCVAADSVLRSQNVFPAVFMAMAPQIQGRGVSEGL